MEDERPRELVEEHGTKWTRIGRLGANNRSREESCLRRGRLVLLRQDRPRRRTNGQPVAGGSASGLWPWPAQNIVSVSASANAVDDLH